MEAEGEEAAATLVNETMTKRNKIRAYMPQVFAAFSVSLGNMLVGFVSGYTAPALVSMKEDTSGRLGEITAQVESWTASLLPLFAIFGSICGGLALDKLGRQKTILFLAVPYFISFLIIGFAQHIWHVYLGRCIAGFATGIASMAAPVYLGESLQAELRGFLGTMPTTMGNVGFLLCFFVGSYVDWSQLALFGAVIPIPFMICVFLIPETPRCYISKGEKIQARKSLQWLRGKDSDVSQELLEYERSHQESLLQRESSGCADLLSRRYQKPLYVCVSLMLFQQMSGFSTVMFYNTEIFKSAKSSLDPKLCTVFVGVINLGTVLVVSVLVDRLGRKALLYASGTVMTVTITALGIYFRCYEQDESSVEGLGWIPMACFGLYVVGFTSGFGTIPWLMMGEILPAKVRGTGASLATAINWLALFLVSFTFKLFARYSTLFWSYGVFCFVSIFFVFKSVPETRGKSLEDIEKTIVRDERAKPAKKSNDLQF